MTDLTTAIRSLILADTDVSDLIGPRCVTDILPQGSTMPAVVFNVVSESAQNCLSGFPVGTDSAIVQIDSYGKTRLEAETVWRAVKKAIAGFRGVIADTEIKGVAQSSGRHFITDRPELGTDSWRFRSIQDFYFVYVSYERV